MIEILRFKPTSVSLPPTIFVPAFFTPHLTCAAVETVVVNDVFVVLVVETVVVVVALKQRLL